MDVLGCPRKGVAVTLSGYRAQDGGSARQLSVLATSARRMGRGNNRQLKPLIRNSTGQPSCFTKWIWSCPRG